MNIRQAEYWSTPDMPDWNRNPLVKTLGKFRSEVELTEALKRNPYAGRNVQSLPYELRKAEIARLTNEAFVVTSRELGMASALQEMLWNSVARRMPTCTGELANVLRLSRYLGSDIDDLPWNSQWADCAKVDEITGLGKTHDLRRIFALWPQAVRHPRLAGVWESWLQLVHLHVDLSFDGNLQSLLLHLLVEVDRAFDCTTNYAVDIPKRARNIAQLQVWVMAVLVRHFAGVVTIDELQAISLLLGRDRRQVANFFLRLLNQGIPVIFAGNPFAFEALESMSQLSDRLGAVVLPDLLPSGFDDEDAKEQFFPQIWQMQVMPVIEEPKADVCRAVFECSAWHPRHVVRAIQNGQRIAIAKGSDRLSAEHIRSGFEHLAKPAIQRRIRAFVEMRPLDLLEWDDIPIVSLSRSWGVEDETTLACGQAHDERASSRREGEAGAKQGPRGQRAGKTGRAAPVTMGDVAAMNKQKLDRAAKRSKARAKRQAESRARAEVAHGAGNPLAHALVNEFNKMNSAKDLDDLSGFDLIDPPH